MEWFLWGMVVVVLGLAAVAAAGRFGGMPTTAVHDSPVPELPDRPLTGDDLRHLRFAVTPRGYSMAQIDDLLDRLALELDEHDAQTPVGTRVAVRGGDAVAAEEWAKSPASDSELFRSAIMDPDVSQQPGEEGEHGSNEAPHG
ncbi:DivIVA domain-containing protein [Propioniciclava coleopterorum]|uniref:DivIVA domain-containing protein n=1 Tax=Propioniciclava coleopterorum TaxID=2714937 RepID=A0A6G7YBB6_9ACTN|nr:DivIVA domain-containing protein [Propioniciclava coleopterorum]QIK73941.1 DivIVA domain-containing protein [Propioniciclava coleopterorum]